MQSATALCSQRAAVQISVPHFAVSSSLTTRPRNAKDRGPTKQRTLGINSGAANLSGHTSTHHVEVRSLTWRAAIHQCPP
jgi:hypothetical protein